MYYLSNIESNRSIDGLQNILKVTDANHVNQNMMCEALLSIYSKLYSLYILKFSKCQYEPTQDIGM